MKTKKIAEKTSEALTLICRHHKEFINTVKSLYGNNFSVVNYAEDYMQEVYIKLGRYDDLYEKVIKKDGSVSKGYVFFAIRSVVLNDLKKKKVINYDYKGDLFEIEKHFEGKNFHIGGGVTPSTSIIDEERDETQENRDDIEEQMYRVAEENNDWFNYQLFKVYLSDGQSYRSLAADTGIGIQTIYLSIKRTKMIIAEKLFEQYSKIKKERL